MSLELQKIVPNSNYFVERLLGSGAYGEVYLATHIHLKIHRALKVLNGTLNQKGINEFKKEAQRVAGLSISHQDIVQVVEFFFLSTGEPVMVLEFMPGGSLEEIVESQNGDPLPLKQVIEYVRPLARALQHAHDQGFIHRDVKPANCLLTADGKVKLADFGIAVDAKRSTSMRAAGAVGTISYMAPEQIQSIPTFRSDQYALAILIWELVTGDLPFTGTLAEVYQKQLLIPPPSLDLQKLNIPASTEVVLQKALCKDPKGRFNRIEAFMNALEHSRTSPQLYVPPVIQSAVSIAPPVSYPTNTPMIWISQMPLGYISYVEELANPSSPLHPTFFKQLRPILLEAFRTRDFTAVGSFALAEGSKVTREELLSSPRNLRGISPLEFAVLRAVEPDLFFVGNRTIHNKVLQNLSTIYQKSRDNEILPLGFDADTFLSKYEKLSHALNREYVPFLRSLEEQAYQRSQLYPIPLSLERQRYYDFVAQDARTRIPFFDALHPLLRAGLTAKNWEPVYQHVLQTYKFDFTPIYSFEGREQVSFMDFALYRCTTITPFLYDAFSRKMVELFPVEESLISTWGRSKSGNSRTNNELASLLKLRYQDLPDFVDEVIVPLIFDIR